MARSVGYFSFSYSSLRGHVIERVLGGEVTDVVSELSSECDSREVVESSGSPFPPTESRDDGDFA